ncbi:MAG: hypothetical protein KatS3mg131_3944 [Candidatus Tectimicrobiota bacterium]|nr:MAG: hypothetical protein KatS3mg131_3944 [Candidatus Tectomicrobia bacterium]
MWNQKPASSAARYPAAGFTLLEVLVALAIVAIALVIVLRLHLLSLDATLRAQDLTTAVLLAQGKLASLGAFPEPGEEDGQFEEPQLARYRWHTQVTAHTLPATETGSEVEVRRIEVTVSWRDGRQERHYTLQSYALR